MNWVLLPSQPPVISDPETGGFLRQEMILNSRGQDLMAPLDFLQSTAIAHDVDLGLQQLEESALNPIDRH